MPTYTTIGDNYLVSQTPWPHEKARNRDWYEPFMMAPYVRDTMWYNMIRYWINMKPVHAENAVFTQRILPEPDPTELELRGITAPRQYFDSKNMTVSYKSYGGSVMLHKYDQMIYQWARTNEHNPQIRNTGIPQPDLLPLIQGDLSLSLTQTLDLVARNAFLANSKNYSFASDATGFHDLASTDRFDPEVARLMKYNAEMLGGNPDMVFPCITSPAVTDRLSGLEATTRYIEMRKAVQDKRLLNYYSAEYMDVTFLTNRRMILYNTGEVLASASITQAIEPGDGAPDPETTKVDNHWATGAADATHYIQLSSITDPSTAETGFKVGDIVTLCREKAAANGTMATSGAAKWNGAKNINARVVSVDYDNNRICLENPVLNENYFSAISTGLYGYVVKARPVHVGVFLYGGLRDPGVAGVVMEPPRFYINPPIDTRQARWEFAWDAYMDYAIVNPDAFGLYFFAGDIIRHGSSGIERVAL